MDSWYLSYFMDTTEEERARGKTVSCGHGLFQTDKRFYYLIDAPGLQKYTTEEERARGKTVSCGHGLFQTDKRFYYLIDAPGHQKYITEMISGSSYAEVAIMVISARTGEFEAGFVKN